MFDRFKKTLKKYADKIFLIFLILFGSFGVYYASDMLVGGPQGPTFKLLESGAFSYEYNGEQFNISLQIPFDYNNKKGHRNDFGDSGFYPFFNFTVPNPPVANYLKNNIIIVTYTLSSTTDISDSIGTYSIDIDGSYKFVPRFYCEVQGKETASGQIEGKRLIDANTIEIDVSYNFSKWEDGNILPIDIQSGDVISCYDPVLPEKAVLGTYNGILILANATQDNLYQANWTSAGWGTMGNVTGVGAVSRQDHTRGDFSLYSPVGVYVIADDDRKMHAFALNTSGSKGKIIANRTYTGGSVSYGHDVVCLNNSGSCAIFYDDNIFAAAANIRMMLFNGTAFEDPVTITFDTPPGGADQTRSIEAKRRPGNNDQVSVSWYATGITGVGFIVYDVTNNILIANYSTPTNIIVTDQANSGLHQDHAWTEDGRYLFFMSYNYSAASTTGETFWLVYDAQENTYSDIYWNRDTAADMEAGMYEACSVPTRNDSVGVIITTDDSDTATFIYLVNGSVEAGFPGFDDASYQDGSTINENIGCYASQENDELLFLWDSNDDGIDHVIYNATDKSWYDKDHNAITDLDSAPDTGHLNGDRNPIFFVTPCQEGDCAMISGIDNYIDTWSGLTWNGTDFDLNELAELDQNAQASGYRLEFFFEANLTTAAGSPPATKPVIYSFFDGFESGDFGNWTNNSFSIETSEPHNGTYYAGCPTGCVDGNITINYSINTTGFYGIKMDLFQQADAAVDGGDIMIYFNDSSGNWDEVYSVNSTLDAVWEPFTFNTTDSQYLHQGFTVLIRANVTSGEIAYWDDINITELQDVDPYGGFLSVSLDKNTTTTSSIFFNWTGLGSIKNYTVWYNNSGTWEAIANTTDTSNYNYTHTGLTNNTWYDYQVNATWNSTVQNSTGVFFIQTDQTSPVAPITHNIVLNLTFDDPDRLLDHSGLHGTFTNSSADWFNRSTCKWYGCYRFNDTAELQDTQAFRLGEDGWHFRAWVYPVVDPATTHQPMFLKLRNDFSGAFFQILHDNFGLKIRWNYDDLSFAEEAIGSGDADSEGVWYLYDIVCEAAGGGISYYKNGVFELTDSNADCTNITMGTEALYIGGDNAGDPLFFMDEVQLYNTSNITEAEILAYYTATKTGTPPDADIYVKHIRYNLSEKKDWTDLNNTLEAPPTEINITIEIWNEGVTDTAGFEWNFTIDNYGLVCAGNMTLGTVEGQNVTCNMTITDYGLYKGWVNVDIRNNVTEDQEETNNAQRFYLMYKDLPWFTFDLADIPGMRAFCANTTGKLNDAIDSTCNWIRSQGGFSFNWATYECDNVDSYGTQARMAALACAYNNYDDSGSPGNNQCPNAHDILHGWSSRDPTLCSNVQSDHYYSHVGIGFQIMAPNMTEANYTEIVDGLEDICQALTLLTGVQNDDETTISGDNGIGFGAGMGTLCYSLMSLEPDNPTMMLEKPDQYWSYNAIDEWIDRDQRFLRSYKNDSWTFYPEGTAYYNYGLPNIVNNAYFHERYGILDLNQYQNAMCSIANEMMYTFVEGNLDGNSWMGGTARSVNMRIMSRGDGDSYPFVGSFYKWGYITMAAAMCDQNATKASALRLMDEGYDNGDYGGNQAAYTDWYIWEKLYDSIGGTWNTVDNGLPKFVYANADDNFVLRTNFTYENDTVIFIDGGEERMGGHSLAQTYFVHALGHNFCAFQEYTLNDDTKDERWGCSISLHNATGYISEGITPSGGGFNRECGVAPLSQYYGSTDGCEEYVADYPDYRRFPLTYGGDMWNYIGNDLGTYGGVRKELKYEDANVVREDHIIYDNLFIKRNRVEGATTGGIYQNLLSIDLEFDYVQNGNNFTQNASVGPTGWMNTQLVWSNETTTLLGGQTNVSTATHKTNPTQITDGNYTRYYWLTETNNVDMIYTHTWYQEGGYTTVTELTGNDRGVSQGTNNVLFDTDEDGDISYSSYDCDGWGMTYDATDAEYGCFNGTHFNTSTRNNVVNLSDSASFQLIVGENESTFFINTFKDTDNDGYDYTTIVVVNLDLTDMTLNENFTVQKDGVNMSSSESGSTVTFTATTGQNGAKYTILGGTTAAGEAGPNITTTITATEYNNKIRFNPVFGAGVTTAYDVEPNGQDGSGSYQVTANIDGCDVMAKRTNIQANVPVELDDAADWSTPLFNLTINWQDTGVNLDTSQTQNFWLRADYLAREHIIGGMNFTCS